MQIIKLEIKDIIKKTFFRICIVSLAMALLLLFYFQLKPQFIELAERLNELPPELLKLIGAGTEINIIKITYFFTYIMVIGNIILAYHALSSGSNALLKEEKRGSVYYLFAKPVGRSEVVLYKYMVHLLAYALEVLLLFFITAIFVIPSVSSKTVQIKWLKYNGEVLAGSFLLGAVFLSLGFWYSSFLPKEKEAEDYSFYTILVFLIMGSIPNILRLANLLCTTIKGRGFAILEEIGKKTEFLQNISPFEWLNPVRAMEGGYKTPVFITCIILSAGLLGISLICYNRRDFR